MTNGAAGVLLYNNTILTETTAGSSANVHWRNNLMLGENSAPPIFSVNTNTNYSSSDYNGFRLNPKAEFSFQWKFAAVPDSCRLHWPPYRRPRSQQIARSGKVPDPGPNH